jgi:hypothetical protein
MYMPHIFPFYDLAAERFALLAGGRAWTKLREQDSVRARKMLENGAESHPSSARFVGTLLDCKTHCP